MSGGTFNPGSDISGGASEAGSDMSEDTTAVGSEMAGVTTGSESSLLEQAVDIRTAAMIANAPLGHKKRAFGISDKALQIYSVMR